MSDSLLVPTKNFRLPSSGQSILCDEKFYSIGEIIGQGHFGCVYECSDEWGNELAAKVLLPKERSYDVVRENWTAELKKLVDLRHPNITYVHQAFEFNDTFYLVMERCWMTLERVITMPNLWPDAWIPHVARDVLQGLDFIHINNYVHKDIHPGNIFVSRQFDRMDQQREAVWSFKIGDLGISRLETDINPLNTVLADWMLPPEALNPSEFGQVGRVTDIYHVAILLLSLILNRIPVFTKEEILDGLPRQLAERSSSIYAPAIARALRRHTSARTSSAILFWRDLQTASFAATVAGAQSNEFADDD